jgi:MYM-type Zinc finger with FCS sequence motif
VVEHPLGKGEVVSSILTGSTDKSGISDNALLQNHTERNAKRRVQYAPNPHQTFAVRSTHQIELRTSIITGSGRQNCHPPPDIPKENPAAVGTAHGAQTNDQLDGVIEKENKSAASCEYCGKEFQPRTGNGGRAQKFCSPECRRAFLHGRRP